MKILIRKVKKGEHPGFTFPNVTAEISAGFGLLGKAMRKFGRRLAREGRANRDSEIIGVEIKGIDFHYILAGKKKSQGFE